MIKDLRSLQKPDTKKHRNCGASTLQGVSLIVQIRDKTRVFMTELFELNQHFYFAGNSSWQGICSYRCSCRNPHILTENILYKI